MGVGIDKPRHKCLAESINNRCTRGVYGCRGYCVDVVVFDNYIETLLQRCKPVEYDVGVSKMYIGHFPLTLFRLDRPYAAVVLDLKNFPIIVAIYRVTPAEDVGAHRSDYLTVAAVPLDHTLRSIPLAVGRVFLTRATTLVLFRRNRCGQIALLSGRKCTAVVDERHLDGRGLVGIVKGGLEMRGLARPQPRCRRINDLELDLLLVRVAQCHPQSWHRTRRVPGVGDIALDDQPVGGAYRNDLSQLEPGPGRHRRQP